MKRLVLLFGVLISLSAMARAGDQTQDVVHAGEKDWSDGGALELELMSGAVAGQIGQKKTSYSYTDTELRLGYMLYSPRGSGFLRGNTELMANAGGGGIFHGPGDAYGTVGGLLRYNFIQPSARFVPYFQGGAAAFISDIAESHVQRDIGGTFEADLRAAAGTRLFICRGWSLNGEFFFDHVSNGGTQRRNVGINALGGLLGVSRSF
jgi:Lipid A 3-O-deacylase (PagL)